MKKYGLIGYPLSHSFSPGYFAKKFAKEGIEDTRYDLYPLEHIDEVKKLLDGHMAGINVTIPYKLAIMPFLDRVSDDALEIGAVNTVMITKDEIVGYNSDIYGFSESIRPLVHKDVHTHALILGTGGSSKAVRVALKQLGISYQFVSTSGKGISYDSLDSEIMSQHQLIINTTPVGMSPNSDQCPRIPYEHIGADHILFDLVYNPEKTLFLSKGEAQGAQIKNGLEMLHLQAEKSWEIWNQ